MSTRISLMNQLKNRLSLLPIEGISIVNTMLSPEKVDFTQLPYGYIHDLSESIVHLPGRTLSCTFEPVAQIFFGSINYSDAVSVVEQVKALVDGAPVGTFTGRVGLRESRILRDAESKFVEIRLNFTCTYYMEV